MDRRTFLAAAGGALWTAGADAAPGAAAAAIHADEGDLVYVGRASDPVRIKVDPPGAGRFGMITQEVSPGTVIPVHLHEREDEIIFIGSGEGVATLGEQRVPLRAGSTLYVPQGTWHGGENTGRATLLWVAIYSPAGFEGYFRAIGATTPGGRPPQRSREAFERLDREYGIRYRR